MEKKEYKGEKKKRNHRNVKNLYKTQSEGPNELYWCSDAKEVSELWHKQPSEKEYF